MKKRIYLPVEIQNRELDVRLDLAEKMIARNWEVVIGRFNDVVNLAQKLGGGVLFYKAHSDTVIKKKLLPAKEAGSRLVCLDEEGLIFPSTEWYLRHRIGTGEHLSKIDAIFTWGPLQHKILSSEFPEVSQNLYMTGNGRIRPTPRSVKKDRNIILINTNFGPGNLSETIRENYVEMVMKQRTETTPEERFFLESRQEYYSALVRHYVTFLHELSELNSRLDNPFKIILRPHPIENMNFWEDALSEVNIRVETKLPSQSFFSSCHCMIHTGCTTALEGFMTGTPVLRYNPIYPSKNIQESIIPNAISKNITKAEEVFLKHPEVEEIEGSLVDYIYFGSEAPNELQAKIIEKFEVLDQEAIKGMPFLDAFFDQLRVLESNFIIRNPKLAKVLFHAKALEKRRSQLHRWPLLGKRDLKKRCSRPISVKRIEPQVFLLQGI